MIAHSVLQTCLQWGVRDFCFCAGSRNSPLVDALLRRPGDLEPILQLFPFFEERAAAFFALGRIQATRRPVAVLTTSGTAAAELLPATIEAHYQALPLILLTADRPPRFRGSGAPQAIEQLDLLTPYAEVFDLQDWKTAAQLPPTLPAGRPIHLNICLEEPQGDPPPPFSLSLPSSSPADDIPFRQVPSSFETVLTSFLNPASREPLLVIAGCLPQPPPQPLIEALLTLQSPILADITSGLHASPDLHPLLLHGGDQTARSLNFKRVLRLGGVPSFRLWRDLESLGDREVLSLSQRPFTGLARPSQFLHGDPGDLLSAVALTPQSTPAGWREISSRRRRRLSELLHKFPQSEPACLQALLPHLPDDALVFVGNSLPIRELALVASAQAPWRTFSNRGANGIDGNLATFFGLASAQPDREAWAIVGDLTTLYDLAAPAILDSLDPFPLRIVVINNQGGKIFRRLPNFRHLSEEQMALVENRHRFHFRDWARAWGLDHQIFQQTLDDLPGRVVLELRPDPEQSDAFWQAWDQNPPNES